MRRQLEGKRAAEPDSRTPERRDRVIRCQVNGRVVDMGDANLRQRADSQQEMPAAYAVAVIMKRVVSALLEDAAECGPKSRQFFAPKADVVDARAQRDGLAIEYAGLTTGAEEVRLNGPAAGPVPQQFHQPGFGTADAETVQNMEDFQRSRHV